MSSNNPVLKTLPGVDSQRGTGYQGYGATNPYEQAPMGASAGTVSEDRPMTVDDVVTKTGITLAVIVAFAVINFGLYLGGYGSIASILTLVGAVAGFVLVMIHAFGKKYGSPVITLAYAAAEGLFLGGFSFAITGRFSVAGADAGALIFQAILGTFGVFAGMLVVYRTGAIRVTPRFNRILTAAIFGVLILVVGNLLLSIFTGMNPLRGGGTIAIVFSLVCIVLGALAFLQDFDVADKLVRMGAPSQAAWGVALGLAVTLVWLYTEILRLLSYFQQR